eukprot:1158866-Pelagomonas_calceolata.AAC.13
METSNSKRLNTGSMPYLTISNLCTPCNSLLPGTYLPERWRAGEGDSGHPGAWQTTLQIPISSLSGFLLG